MAKRLVRAESVSTGENFLSPGRAVSSGDCSGGSIPPPPRSSAQPLVPMEARSAGRSACRTGDEILSPVPAISSGTGKRTGSSPGKVSSKTSSSARVTYKKRGPRQGKVPTPGPTAHSVPADDPSAPGPVAVATGAGGGLLGPAVGASLARVDSVARRAVIARSGLIASAVHRVRFLRTVGRADASGVDWVILRIGPEPLS